MAYHIWQFIHGRELGELYTSISIRTFATSMLQIFIPLYLLSLNYSLFLVLLFYIVTHLVHMLMVIPATKLCSRYGFKHSILFSAPFYLLFSLMLYSLEVNPWMLAFAATIFGIENALFWTGYHLDFAMFSRRSERGKQVGLAFSLFRVFNAIGPFAGGLVLAIFGFKTLFIIVAVLLFLSAVPLFMSKDVHEPLNFNMQGLLRGQKFRNFMVYATQAIQTASETIFWPIIVFGILGSYSSLGILQSISWIISLLAISFISKYSDVNRRLMLRLGAVFSATVWYLRTLVKLPVHIFLTDSLYGLAQTAWHIPLTAMSYDKSKQDGLMRGIVFREMAINLGWVLFLMPMLYLPGSSLYVALASSFLMFLF